MAEAEYFDEPGRAMPGGPSLNTPINLIGAAVSVALIIGLGIWSYQLAVRDVSGVPVVRALEGPMRVKPEDPGGRPAAYQGLAVNEVPAEGVAGPPPERLILAPKPLEIPESDLAMLAPEAPEPVPLATATDLAVAAALAESGLADVEDLAAVASPAVLPAELLPASVPGVAASPRPGARPRTFQLAYATVPAPAEITQAVVEVAPADVPQGARLVQLGAYETPDLAREAWNQLTAPFADYMEGRSRVIQEATSGGRTFYRLRVLGFADLADARRFCSVLLAEDAPCIPVVAR